MNDEQALWAYIARLERAIRESMERSEEIAEIVSRLQDHGVQVSINCIAQIVTPDGVVLHGPQGEAVAEDDDEEFEFDPEASALLQAAREEDAAAATADGGDEIDPLRFELDDDDRRFLDDLGLRLE